MRQDPVADVEGIPDLAKALDWRVNMLGLMSACHMVKSWSVCVPCDLSAALGELCVAALGSEKGFPLTSKL
ncbi:hypothetical protein HAP41_0000004720 [Bradyrhizobium barranii subsp. apii]|uniref:Uncharacterized protein n=2 Tax=Bradyrhizobium TaxID=374 RepID=A0A8T5VNE6_9BRAD|nr:hypothetical protein [Bradyrhizobium barranii]UPT88435.1 hypothetical protein HAP41_0000004720 [Bradyrhizobium barranii subsp. apii]UPT95892.1 hypothetical protein J4G48_0043295 [Bradyrhizobium barranii subsp. apii]